jgi:hypothetical protein
MTTVLRAHWSTGETHGVAGLQRRPQLGIVKRDNAAAGARVFVVEPLFARLVSCDAITGLFIGDSFLFRRGANPEHCR